MTLELAVLVVAQLLDTCWVGRLGPEALAAVTISVTVRWVLNSLADGLGATAIWWGGILASVANGLLFGP